jgi:hypothetical protein
MKLLSSGPLKGRPFDLTHKHKTKLERLAKDKHSSLLSKFVTNYQKRF